MKKQAISSIVGTMYKEPEVTAMVTLLEVYFFVVTLEKLPSRDVTTILLRRGVMDF